jgi:hypothetical protein
LDAEVLRSILITHESALLDNPAEATEATESTELKQSEATLDQL